MKEVEGSLWHLGYPLTPLAEEVSAAGGAPSSDHPIDHGVVATTRPETMLGDTAVAVNSRDPRYAQLVGRTITLPLVDRQIPIVADEHVDPAFGTGCVKVTPARVSDDFAVGARHARARTR